MHAAQSSRFHQDNIAVREDDGQVIDGYLAGYNPTYYTLDQIENSPTHQDGQTIEQVNKYRKTYTNMILVVCEKMRVPTWGASVAIQMWHRFYMKKSMMRNDRYTITVACLFLGLKVAEHPKHLKHVIACCEEYRFRSKSLSERARCENDAVYAEHLKESVLCAERAVLYTLGFDFQIGSQHPYQCLLDEVKPLSSSDPNLYRMLVQICWNFLNDSLRTTLCLQYPPRAIAMAALFSARLVLRLPSPQPSFFQQHNINAAYVKDIVDQLWRTYRVHAEASGVLQLSSPVGSLTAADGRLQLQEPLPRAEVGPKAEGGVAGNGHPGQQQQQAQQYGYGTQQQAVAG